MKLKSVRPLADLFKSLMTHVYLMHVISVSVNYSK